MLSAVFVTIGQMKGQTLLPLPSQTTMPTMQPEQGLKDQDKIHILESAIVTWTKQIKNVLKADPDAPLKVRCLWHAGAREAAPRQRQVHRVAHSAVVNRLARGPAVTCAC